MDDTQKILGLVAGKSSVNVLIGTYVGLSGMRVLVDVGGSRIPMQTITAWRPLINDNVTVIFIDDIPYMVGPTVPLPGDGVVVSTASNLATVSTDIGNVVAPYPSGATLTAGQQVKLYWSDGPYVISVMSVNPAAPVPPPPAGGGSTSHQQVFTATDSGSYGSRWFTNLVYASDSNLGLWFYGTKIRDTIVGSASVSKVELYISDSFISGSAPNIAVHGYGANPGSAPSLLTVGAIPISFGWVTIDAANSTGVGNALKAGGGYLGVGFNHGGYSIMNNLTTDPQSGALRITWTA